MFLRKTLYRILIFAIVGYSSIVGLMLLFEDLLVFHPSTAMYPKPRSEIEDLDLTCQAGNHVHAWWFPREQNSNALILLHGNAGNISYLSDGMQRLADRLDVSVLAVDYPGYGKSPGTPSEAGCYQAADAVYDWLIERGTPATQIIIMGESLGGAVAVDLASRREHRSLLLYRTFTSLPDVANSLYPIIPARTLMRNRFDSLSKIDQCKHGVIVGHGSADHLVSITLGKSLFDAAPEPKRFVVMEGEDHNVPIAERFLQESREFLRTH